MHSEQTNPNNNNFQPQKQGWRQFVPSRPLEGDKQEQLRANLFNRYSICNTNLDEGPLQMSFHDGILVFT